MRITIAEKSPCFKRRYPPWDMFFSSQVKVLLQLIFPHMESFPCLYPSESVELNTISTISTIKEITHPHRAITLQKQIHNTSWCVVAEWLGIYWDKQIIAETCRISMQCLEMGFKMLGCKKDSTCVCELLDEHNFVSVLSHCWGE